MASKNDIGQSPLHYAIELGHVEIALFLLDEGGDPNERDNDQWTPLISAAKLGNVELVIALVDKGAKQRDKDDNEIVDMVSDHFCVGFARKCFMTCWTDQSA